MSNSRSYTLKPEAIASLVETHLRQQDATLTHYPFSECIFLETFERGIEVTFSTHPLEEVAPVNDQPEPQVLDQAGYLEMYPDIPEHMVSQERWHVAIAYLPADVRWATAPYPGGYVRAVIVYVPSYPENIRKRWHQSDPGAVYRVYVSDMDDAMFERTFDTMLPAVQAFVNLTEQPLLTVEWLHENNFQHG